MVEHEGEKSKKPETGKKGASAEQPRDRGEKKGKQAAGTAPQERAVYEAGRGAREVDPGFEKREELLKSAFERAKQSGKVNEESFGQLLGLLKKREHEELSAKEKASIWELLLVLLRYIWKEITKLFKEQEYAELVAAARASGAKNDAETLLWMIGETGLKAANLGELQDLFIGKATEERQKEGKHSPEKERARLEAMKKGGFQGGAGELSEEEKEEVAEMGPEALDRAELATERQFEEWETHVPNIIRQHTEIADDLVEHKVAVQELLDELHRLKAIPERERDVDRITDLQRQLELEYRMFKGLIRGLGEEEFSRYMNFYGPWAMALIDEINDYKKDGIYTILAARPETISSQSAQEVIDKLKARSTAALPKDRRLSEALSLQAESLQVWVRGQEPADRYAALSVDRRVEEGNKLKERVRRDVIKPLIEKIIGDAEDDPREGFRMRPGGDILFSELMDAIRTAGPTGRYDKQMFESGFFTRRVVQFIQSEMIKRADPERLVDPRVGGNLFSEDLDTLMRLEPGLGPARRIVERVLAQTRLNPEHEGRIPNAHLNPDLRGAYEPPMVEKIVAEELMVLSDNKALIDRDGNPFRIRQEEAERLAALAMKISNLELRTAEHLSMTPLPTKKRGEYIKSTPQDKMRFDIMRFTGERFERFGQGREAIWPIIRRMNQFVQPGVYEKIPGVAFDDWEVNPENFLHIGGIDSASTWRILAATKEVRELDLALGVQLYDEEKKKPEIWGKVGDRLPTVVSRYFAILALKGVVKQEAFDELPADVRRAFLVGDQSDYFNLEKRLRGGLLDNTGDFIDYVRDKAELKVEDEVFDELKKELLEDVESKLVAYRGGKEAAGKALKNVKSPEDVANAPGVLQVELRQRLGERKQELELQIGAQSALLWTVAEATGQLENRPPHSEYEGLRKKQKELKEELAKERDEKKKSELNEAQKQVDKDLQAWHTRVKEWEGTVWGEWETLEKRLIVLEEKAMQDYVRAAEEAKKSGQPLPEHPQVLQMARDADFSPNELQIVERLTNLGGRSRAERGEGAARLADVKFSFIAFTEDILHEKARWQELGSADIVRRYGDTEMAASGAELIWRISSGLAGQQDKVIATRQELLKSLVELQESLGYLSGPDRQKVNAALTHEIINNLFKADAWWLHIPLVGPLMDMEWPWGSIFASSRAQRKFGLKALSMTALERWRFIEDMRPFVGNQYADKLQLMLKARRRDVVWQVTRQWGLPAAAYLGWEWVLGPALKQLQAYMSDTAR